jgi:glycosyltransferase involved in cell wall biosynthesis
MLSKATPDTSLVSVIVTCYNHARFLARAIGSIQSQNYKNIEIIVVDDGSTDETADVALKFPDVRYVYKPNQGLSAARNTGAANSAGDFIVFLDADDWLLPAAIATNVQFLQQNPEAAFVSGGHIIIYKDKDFINNPSKVVNENHYCHFLEGNYVQMHATVMYRRRIFDEFEFDVSLKACEDYDLYLKVSRKYPVIHHTKLLAAYYIHDQNMSGNIPKMLESSLAALGRQKESLKTAEEEKYFRNGLDAWKKWYCRLIFEKLLFAVETNKKLDNSAEIETLRKYRKFLFLQYLILKKLLPKKSFIQRNVPNAILRAFHKIGVHDGFVPAQGKINFGDFYRTKPFNNAFGYTRGGPVDRYYIENFLEKNSDYIRGKTLEIGDNEYTRRFGGEKVTESDILHIDDKNPNATIIGDLSDAPHIADNSFDCIILTQTLHLIYEYKAALETCYRILKPGGALLLTVPGISHIDQGDWKKYWLWSFTDNSISRMLSEIFPPENVFVESFGNVLVATAFLYGIGLPEIKNEQMDYNDPHYQVIICAAAVKSNKC